METCDDVKSHDCRNLPNWLCYGAGGSSSHAYDMAEILSGLEQCMHQIVSISTVWNCGTCR